jgi:magnesium chelatase family protein
MRSSIMLADTAPYVPSAAEQAAAAAFRFTVSLASRAAPANGSVPVRVSVCLERGEESMQILGVSKAAQQNANRRVREALKAAHIPFPRDHVVVQLQADTGKGKNTGTAQALLEGAERFDLPIVLGLLAAMRRIPAQALEGREFYGELTSTGRIEALVEVQETLQAAAGARCVIPAANDPEARPLSPPQRPADTAVALATHLLEVCADLRDETPLPTLADPPSVLLTVVPSAALAELPVTYQAARALLITAAGGHPALFIGAQNTALFSLVNCLPALLPPLSPQEALALALVKARNGAHVVIDKPQRRPWVTPADGLLADDFFGKIAHTGELTKALHGVCYLKELVQFQTEVLQELAQVLRTGMVQPTVPTSQKYALPFQLVASMFPCGCGFGGDVSQVCHCSEQRQIAYLGRIPDALYECLQVCYVVRRLRAHEAEDNRERLGANPDLAGQVARARAAQLQSRQMLNAQLSDAAARKACALRGEALRALHYAQQRFALSVADVGCVYRLALTIAALDNTPLISAAQVREAVCLRRPEAASATEALVV